MNQSKLPSIRTSLRGSSAGSSPQSTTVDSRLQGPGKKSSQRKQSLPDKHLPAPDTPSKMEDNKESINITAPLPVTSNCHRDLTQCPCGESGKTSWQIDCSKCHQFWHVECLSLGGLGQAGYNKLVDFL